MKILLITTVYPTPVRPRQGTFNQTLVTALSAQHELRVIAPIPWTQQLSHFSDRAACGQIMHPHYFYPPKILREHYHHFYWRAIRSSIHRLEQAFVPDVVLGYWLHPDGAAAVRAAKHFHIPAIVMSGGSDLRLLTQQAGRSREILQVINQADRLIVFSRELAAQAARRGVAQDKLDVIYRGIDPAWYFPIRKSSARATLGLDVRELVIFWAGRLDAVKNPAMLLYAAQDWHRQWGDRLRVIVAGDGPLAGRLRRLRDQLALKDTVHFVGSLTRSELALHYNAADVTVLTSHSEGIPNVLLESIACGTPFVATDVGGVAEIASPGFDRLVPAGDVRALTAAVGESLQTRTTGQRTFIPGNLADMAAQFDATLGRVTGRPTTSHRAVATAAW